MKKLYNPVLIPIVSVPHFILGCLLAAANWNNLGFSRKGRNTLKWGLIGSVVLVITALYIPVETLKLMWPIGIGINIGVGMALRTLQTPEYNQIIQKRAGGASK